MSGSLRLPAEWEPQDGVVLAWPHEGTDWASALEPAEWAFAALARAVAERQICLIVVPDAACERRARQRIGEPGGGRLRFVHAPYDDTWLRDSGPIAVESDEGFRLLDFRFTGWGGKYRHAEDDRLVARLFAAGIFSPRCRHRRVDFALEGGAIDCDGEGHLLTTVACLERRHPGRSRREIEAVLRRELGVHTVFWLAHGALAGDDTDAHVDTLARFAPDGTILHQGCDDPNDEHFEPLAAMAAELSSLRRADGRPFRLLALPWPRPVHSREGRRLAAGYANFLVLNGAVLVPVFEDPADERALSLLAAAFPGREMVPIPARALIEQNGSVHCLTMQLPAGVLP
jgi:agmatine/peptidylarginine deiminase